MDNRNRKGVMLRINPESWRKLKMIAIDENTTLQAIVCNQVEVYLAGRESEPAKKTKAKT